MNDAKLYSIIRAPRVSEKTARLQEVSNQYVFEVATDATKADIKVWLDGKPTEEMTFKTIRLNPAFKPDAFSAK